MAAKQKEEKMSAQPKHSAGGYVQKLIRLSAIAGTLLLLCLCIGSNSLAATWYVRPGGAGSGNGTGWSNAFSAIQQGIDAAAAVDEIWVAQGVYLINSPLNLNKKVTLYGGFTGIEASINQRDWKNNVTTIDGGGVNNAPNVPHCLHITADASVDGFKITGGYYGSQSGAGVFIDECSATITNSTIIGNRADFGGGGILCTGALKTPLIYNCIIIGNAGGFGGGGIECRGASPRIINCVITGNGGETVGGIFCGTGSPYILNSTIYGNGGRFTGGVSLGNSTSTTTITNSIIWGNMVGGGSTPQINPGSGTVLLIYSNVDQDGFEGTNNNIRLSPDFVYVAGTDAAVWDLHLQPSSPCINAGTNSASELPLFDIDGDPRSSGGAVDMGADEYQFDTAPPVIEMTTPVNGAPEAPVDTNIVVDLSDNLSGIDTATLVMKVNGSAVTPAVTGGSIHYTLTYDPPAKFGNNHVVTVTVSCSDLAGNATGVNTFTFQTAPASGPAYPPDDNDPDGDGMLNKHELAYGTDPGKKTLFVRPKKKVGGTWGFWNEFCDVYRPLLTVYTGTGQGQLGIEIVCVGPWLKTDGTTHHLQYDKLWNLDYDPKTDTQGPVDPSDPSKHLTGPQPIDIVDIYYNDPADPNGITSGTANKGHTFFHSTNKLWYWDIPAHATSTLSYLDTGYLTAYLYPFTIDRYFTEGQYDSIALNATKQITGNTCYGIVCDKQVSPFNYDKYNETPPSGVEHNLIVFDASGAVTADPVLSTTQWSQQQVILRTLAHEIGHALSGSTIPENDHCEDKLCIMYPFTAQENQWTLTSFHCPVHTVEFMRGKVHNIPGAN
jgi:hypothetical protein